MNPAVCGYCGSEQNEGFKFCSSCGARNQEVQQRLHKKAKTVDSNIEYLSAYTLIIIVALVVNYFLEADFLTIVVVTVVFAIIDVWFAVNQPKVWDVVFKPINPLPLLWIIPLFTISGFVVYFSVDSLNLVLYEDYFEYSFEDTSNPLLYSLIFVAVFPAIFEELAFRGFIFNNLEKISNPKFAIWGSSFLFALVHFSILSLFWLVPFAIILANIRKKYSTILYGMVAHFTHNATVTIIDYYHVL